MSDDPLAALERELVGAARRLAGERTVVRRWRVSLSGLAAATLVAVTVALAAGAVVLLGGHKRVTPAAAAVPGRQQLIDILGVLRRPQTEADLSLPPGMRTLFGAPDVSLIRLATITPWGERSSSCRSSRRRRG
jgi:hypothetical protein